jgi:ketosteroid isomerase-like protein
MPNPTLEQFEVALRASNEAFNRGDFATAFAALAPDCEWHTFEELAGGVLVGPEQVSRFFADLADTFPGVRNEPMHFLQADDGVFVVLWRARGTGGASRVPTAIAHGGLWELREGVPVRVREFSTWEETLSAAGLDPSTAAELRGAERSAS